ncbi:MAG: helix-turn-helix domain-containing protein, partial [Prevotella sp.]|nr:helix-turn-helix domain-containing protein [Prevotella sp.]
SLRPYRLSLSNTGRVFIPIHDAGLYVAYRGKIEKHYSRKGGDSFIPHDLVHHAIEDSKGNLRVATRLGLGIRHSNGHGYALSAQPNAPKFLSEEMYFLTEDNEGTIWAATGDGIIRCDSTYRHYSVEDRNFPIGTPTAFCQDKTGRQWVGTDGMGLCIYNSHKDCFMSVHEQLQLPGDVVTEVTEDSDGALLVNTGTEVIRLSPQELADMRRIPQSEGFKYWLWLLIILAVILGAATALSIYKRQRNLKPSATLKKQPANTEQQATSEQPASREYPSITTDGNPHQQFIDKATDAVRKHLSDYDFDVPQLANELSVSKTTLHRRMKEATGQTTTAFIRSIRLQTACQILLSSPGIRVSDLAYQVGFNDPKYFSRCFKDAYGVLPGDYATENYVAK